MLFEPLTSSSIKSSKTSFIFSFSENLNKSVQVLTKGVEFLFKKNKVTYIKGKGVLFSKNNVVVYENSKISF